MLMRCNASTPSNFNMNIRPTLTQKQFGQGQG